LGIDRWNLQIAWLTDRYIANRPIHLLALFSTRSRNMHRKRKAKLTQRQAIALARRSPKFRTWYAATSVHVLAEEDSSRTGITFKTQKHFTPAELAATWGLSVETIRRLFADEPGGAMMPSASGPTGRCRYRALRIPSSAAARLHKRLSA
jgi:hypothetical protein